MQIVKAAESHALPGRTAFANEDTVMALIDGLTRAGLDYHYYQVAEVAQSIDEQFEIAKSIHEDGGTEAEIGDFLITNEWAIEMLNERVWSDNAPDLDSYAITFNLPRLGSRVTANQPDPT